MKIDLSKISNFVDLLLDRFTFKKEVEELAPYEVPAVSKFQLPSRSYISDLLSLYGKYCQTFGVRVSVYTSPIDMVVHLHFKNEGSEVVQMEYNKVTKDLEIGEDIVIAFQSRDFVGVDLWSYLPQFAALPNGNVKQHPESNAYTPTRQAYLNCVGINRDYHSYSSLGEL